MVEGFTPSPVIMGQYNPPYYNTLYTAFGLEKIKDLLCWEISVEKGYRVPEMILELTDAIQRRYDIRIRELDMSRYAQEVKGGH